MHERSRARRQALQILYQRDITGDTVQRIVNTRSYVADGGEPREYDGEPNEYCLELVAGVESRQAELDETIGEVSEHWTVSRMPFVDRNILRIAAWEITFGNPEEVPTNVAINEAVEMAKVFGGDDSSKFVNGVLGRIAENLPDTREGTP